MTLGQKLRADRLKKSLKQNEVADILNVTPRTMRNYESDRSEISEDRLKQLCGLYGTSPDDYTGLALLAADHPPMTMDELKKIFDFNETWPADFLEFPDIKSDLLSQYKKFLNSPSATPTERKDMLFKLMQLNFQCAEAASETEQ